MWSKEIQFPFHCEEENRRLGMQADRLARDIGLKRRKVKETGCIAPKLVNESRSRQGHFLHWLEISLCSGQLR
jgi:hypothetical protein